MGKSWDQFWHFDDEAYARDVAKLTSEQLTEIHGIVSRRLIASATGAGFGIITMPTTGGLSIAASGVAGRQTAVNRRRLKIIEARIEELQAERYKVRKRDYAIPIAVGAAGVGLATGLEPVFQDIFVDSTAVNAAKVATEMAVEPAYEYAHKKTTSKAATVKANGTIIQPKGMPESKEEDFRVLSVRKADPPTNIAALLPPSDSRLRSRSVSSIASTAPSSFRSSIRSVASNPSLRKQFPSPPSTPPSPPPPVPSPPSTVSSMARSHKRSVSSNPSLRKPLPPTPSTVLSSARSRIRSVASNPSLRQPVPPYSPPYPPPLSARSTAYVPSFAPSEKTPFISVLEKDPESQQIPPLPSRQSPVITNETAQLALLLPPEPICELEATEIQPPRPETPSKTVRFASDSKTVDAPSPETTEDLIRKLTEDIGSYLSKYTDGHPPTYESFKPDADKLVVVLRGTTKHEAFVMDDGDDFIIGETETPDDTGVPSVTRPDYGVKRASARKSAEQSYNLPVISPIDYSDFSRFSVFDKGSAVSAQGPITVG